MPRILEDPTRAICPNFEGAEWEFLRQPLIDAHLGDQPLTLDEVTQRMKAAWSRENDRRIIAWNAQLEEDRAEQEEQGRVAQEEEDARLALQEREAEEQRKEAEKKKPKLHPFDRKRSVGTAIQPRPASYALNKISSLEYIELDYFTERGCRLANADTPKSISHDTLAFTQIEDTIAIRPLAAMRPSKHIRSDEELSWEDFMDAKNSMLSFMEESGVWPEEHAKSLANFFFELELHPRKWKANGKKTLIIYQSCVRRAWFDALKRNKGFNIELIEEDLLRSIAEELSNSIQEQNTEQVRRHPNLGL